MLDPFAQGRIIGGCEALNLQEIVSPVAQSGFASRNTLYARIQKSRGPIVIHSASGEATFGIVAARRGSESNGLMFPVDHVWTGGMRPVHISPDGGAWVVLEEHVVLALPIDGAIWIVHPIARRQEMKLGAEGIGGQFCLWYEFKGTRRSCKCKE